MAIRLALINDYEIVVLGLERMLARYTDRVDIVELNADTRTLSGVDIALYDTFAQGQGDDDDIAALVAQTENIGRVCIFSWLVDPQVEQSAKALGVCGYLSKALTASELVDALERIHAGEKVFSQPIRGQSSNGDWPGRAEGLTTREAEVLALITQGMTNAQIVEQTRLSMNSVKSYIRSAYRKIGVTNRTNAVLWGVDHGLQPDRARFLR